MKKWYQKTAWILVAALALELSGCASGSAYLSRMTGRKSDDQKLVDVDGKAKPKKKGETTKKSDSLRDKATESQLAKKSTPKPKVKSSDDTKQEVASAKETAKSKPVKPASAKESNDPFLSEEFEALAAKSAKNKKIESDTKELASKSAEGALKPTSKSALDVSDGSSKIQEVSHKVEDNLADIGDLPEWATDGHAPAKAAAKSNPAKANAETARNNDAQEQASKSKESAPAKKSIAAENQASVDLVSLCPDAQGELRELVAGLKESDTEGLKRGVYRIGRMGPEAKAAAPAITHLLNHKDGFVRIHSALALSRMQSSPADAVQTVVDGIKSTDAGLRSFAVAVLPEMGPQAADALNSLSESLADQNGYVRLHAAEVLIRYDKWSYQSLDVLLGCLREKDENLRWLAVYSLAELAPESQEAVDALLKASRDPAMKVKVGAVYALGEIGPFAKGASVELRRLADTTNDQELQSAVLHSLSQIEQ